LLAARTLSWASRTSNASPGAEELIIQAVWP
jgi:hypothetical protein